MARQLTSQITFAEAEMAAQDVALDPILQRISTLLDRQKDLVDRVHADLTRGLKQPRSGRDGLTAVQVLRSFIVLRIKNCDLRELRERIADGYSLRIFTRFYSGHVPNHRTFNRNFNRLRPETVRLLNDAVVDAAVKMRLADVSKIRTDTTVVETNIHFPTDSGLLWGMSSASTPAWSNSFAMSLARCFAVASPVGYVAPGDACRRSVGGPAGNARASRFASIAI